MKTLRQTLYTAALLALVATAPVAADFVINDDLIVDGSACIGFDCVNGEAFGFDTIRVKENNLRIKFDDTSVAASFPRNDWQLTANDSANGGAEKFSIDDIGGGRTPFTIEANARSHSLYVDDGGRIGNRTSTPSVEIHTIDGDTPTLRLQQDGSSGFTPQTWDVAGNETNFFIRDVTNGSQLPFRIRPGAPTSSIFVDVNGDVGMGTASPDSDLHIGKTDADPTILLVENTNATAQAVQIVLKTDSENRRVLAQNDAGATQGQIVFDDGGAFRFLGPTGADLRLEIDTSGNLFIQGQCADGGNPGGSCADYVFEPDYDLPSLAELSAFIADNKHLPNVPSTEDIRQNGVNIQSFQGRLLEKIEELTLYTLAQQEKIERLEMVNADVVELRERIARLETAGGAN